VTQPVIQRVQIGLEVMLRFGCTMEMLCYRFERMRKTWGMDRPHYSVFPESTWWRQVGRREFYK
jgi:hypothetical protein